MGELPKGQQISQIENGSVSTVILYILNPDGGSQVVGNTEKLICVYIDPSPTSFPNHPRSVPTNKHIISLYVKTYAFMWAKHLLNFSFFLTC